MLRTRLLILLAACLLLSSASWADNMGYVDCSAHPDGAQVLDKAGMTTGVVATVACGEQFTILVRGDFFSQIRTKDGKVGYLYAYLITPVVTAAPKPQPATAPVPAAAKSSKPIRAADEFKVISVTPSTSAAPPAPAPSAPAPIAAAAQPEPAAPTSAAPAASTPASSTPPAQTQSTASAQPAQPSQAEMTASKAPLYSSPATTPASQPQSATPTSTQSESSSTAAAAQPQPSASVAQPQPVAPTQPTQSSSAAASTTVAAPPKPTEPPQVETPSATAQPTPATPTSAAPATTASEPSAPAAQPQPIAPPETQPAPTQPAIEAPQIRPTRTGNPEPFPTGGVPMFEVFAGYGFTRFGGSNGTNLNGALGSFAYNFMPWLQIIGDASYNFVTINGVKSVVYGDHFGPRIFLRPRSSHGPIPFVEGLVGGTRVDTTSGGVTASNNGLSYKAGGGVDLNLTPHIAVRIVDADYYRIPFVTAAPNSYSASAGIIIRFGGTHGPF